MRFDWMQQRRERHGDPNGLIPVREIPSAAKYDRDDQHTYTWIAKYYVENMLLKPLHIF